MIDIESMALRENIPVLSIGAAFFDKAGIQDEFYMTASLQSCMEMGFQPDADTIIWWMKQERKAQADIVDADMHINALYNQFARWIRETARGEETLFWGNGANFDAPVLRHNFEKLNHVCPWPHYQERCYRSIYRAMGKFIDYTKFDIYDSGTHHNALDDARYQVSKLVPIMNKFDLWE